MEALKFILCLLAFIVPAIIAILFLMKYGKQMVMKGYSGVTAFFAGLFAYALILLAGGMFMASGFEKMIMAVPVYLIFLTVTSLLVWLYAAVVKKLKARMIERAGKRKWTGLFQSILVVNYVLLTLCVLLIPIVIFFPSILPRKTKIEPYEYLRFLLVISVIPGLRMMTRKKKQVSAQRNINDFIDGKFDVLYLRSFHLDEAPFGTAEVDDAVQFGGLTKFDTDIRYSNLSFEGYFGHQITKQLGTFICLGNPRDKLVKDGITAVYPSSDEWKHLLPVFINNARIIFMQIGSSGYIGYELQTIVHAGQWQKLFLFSQPAAENKEGRLLHRFSMWLNSTRPALSWRAVSALMHEAGLQLDFIPPPGAVITFNNHRKAVLVTQHCRLPSEYIAAVKRFIWRNDMPGSTAHLPV